MKSIRFLFGLSSLLLLAGCAASSGVRHGGVFPCVWSDNGFALYPLYYQSTSDGGRSETCWMACGLTGWKSHGENLTASWLVPLYAQGRESFYSLPYSKVEWGRRGLDEYYLAGLGGRQIDDDGRLVRHWSLPLYYRADDLLVTPLYGRSAASDWILPLYYRDANWFATPLYAYRSDARSSERELALPLLLTWAEWNAKGATSFCSLPYGTIGGGTFQTNTWWATPLVGTRSGRREGAWLFPLWSRSSDARFDEKLRPLTAEMIPPEVSFRPEELVDHRGNSQTRVLKSGTVGSGDESTYLLLFDDDRHIDEAYSEADRRYRCTYRRKIGNRLLFGYETRRELVFDSESRWKIGDSGEGGFLHLSFLWRMFRYERTPAEGTAVDFLYIPIWR